MQQDPLDQYMTKQAPVPAPVAQPDPLDQFMQQKASDPLDQFMQKQMIPKSEEPALPQPKPPVPAKPSIQPPQKTPTAPKAPGIIEQVKQEYEKNTPWGMNGMTKDQFDKLPLGQQIKLKLQAFKKFGVDVAESPVRAEVALGREALNVAGGIGSLYTKYVGGPASRYLLQNLGATPEQAAAAVPTSQQVSQKIASLSPEVNTQGDSLAGLVQPQTLPGKLADVGTKGATTALQFAALPGKGLTGAGKAVTAGLAFGAKGGLEAQQQAEVLRGQGKKVPGYYPIASGMLQAAGATVPMGEAGEGVLKNIFTKVGAPELLAAMGAKAGATLGEAEGFTLAQNAIQKSIDPSTGTFDQSKLFDNLANVGAGKLYGTILRNQQKLLATSGNLPAFEPGRTSAIPGRMETPQGAEREFMALGSENQGDQALAMSYLSRLNAKYSPEVREEVTHYLSDADAGVKPQPLSAEGQALLNDPLFKQMQSDMQTRYAEHNKLTGSTNEVRPNYVPRFVTEGVETGQTTPGTARMSQTASNLQSRNILAVTMPDGTRQLVEPGPGDTFKTLTGKRQTLQFYPDDNTVGPVGTGPEGRGQLGQATIREIESQTPVRYRKDVVQDMAQGLVQLGKANRNIDFVNSLKQSGLTTDGTSGVPVGWDKLSPEAQQKFGPVADQYMHPDLARVFEEASKVKAEPNALLKLGQKVVNLGFTGNPLAHAPNQIDHFMTAFTPQELIHGIGDGSFQAALDKASLATRSILEGQPNADAVRYLRSGGVNMLSAKITAPYREGVIENQPSVNTRGQIETPTLNMNRDMAGQTPLSTQYTWAPDQTARMAIAFFREAQGKSLPEAIESANKSYPDYTNPVNRIKNAPVLNKILYDYANNPNALFQRYTLGKFGVLGSNIAGAVQGEQGALGKLTTKALVSTPKYGALGLAIGALIKGLTQNDQYEYRGGGTGKVMREVEDTATQGSPAPFLRSNIIPDPLSNLYMTMTRGDIGGKQLANPSDVHDASLAFQRGDMDGAYKHLSNYAKDMGLGVGTSGLYALANISGGVNSRMSVPEALARSFLAATKDYTPAERLAQEYTSEHSPRVPPNANKADALKDKLALSNALRQNDIETAGNIANQGNLSQQEISGLFKKWSGNDRAKALALTVSRMPFDDAVRAFAVAQDNEKPALQAIAQKKLINAQKELAKKPNATLEARYKEALAQFQNATGARPQGIPSNPLPPVPTPQYNYFAR